MSSPKPTLQDLRFAVQLIKRSLLGQLNSKEYFRKLVAESRKRVEKGANHD
jgi:hypothetical protein